MICMDGRKKPNHINAKRQFSGRFAIDLNQTELVGE